MQQEPCFKVKYIDATKGYGVFATKLLKPGDLILVDECVLGTTDYFDVNVDDVIKNKPTEVQEKVAQLSDSKSTIEETKTTLGIFQTNCSFNIQQQKYMLFPLFARLNHSCWANCTHSLNLKSNCKELRAATQIQGDTELTINYLATTNDWFLTSSERREQLHSLYNFYCSCSLCIQSKQTTLLSDQERQHIFNLFQKCETKVLSYENSFNIYTEIINFLELRTFPPQIIEYFYRNMFLLSCTLSDEENAKFWAKKCRECWVILQGEDCYHARRYSFFSENPFSGFPELENIYGNAELTEHDIRLICEMITPKLSDHCSFCGQKDKLSQCVTCRTAVYCSTNCENGHSDVHKLYCAEVLRFGK